MENLAFKEKLLIMRPVYNSFINTVLLQILHKNDLRDPERGYSVVIIPEVVNTKLWHFLLHNQNSRMIKLAIAAMDKKDDKTATRIVISVPYKADLLALLILAVCVVFEFTSVGLSVYLNHWYVAFYNAVEQYDKQTLLRQLVIFAAITSVMLLNSFLAYFCGQYLIIFMRKPMTENYVSNWLNSKSYLSCATIYDNSEEL